MCNYSVNSITFSSRNLDLLKQLHQKVLACYNSKNENLVRNLLIEHGYSTIKARNVANNRDHFSSCDLSIEAKKPVFFFSCETTSAWNHNLECIMGLLHSHYHNEINLSFCSEEPGMDIYVTKDETGAFYTDKFKVDYCVNDEYATEYFSTFYDVYYYLKESFPKAVFSYYDTLADIKQSIDEAYDTTEEEYFLNINKFKEYDEDNYDIVSSAEVA